MTFVRKIGKDYYVCVAKNNRDRLKKGKCAEFKDWFRVTAYGISEQGISLNGRHIWTPKELFGKKVKFKIEVI